ncbi:site-specific integrase [Amycolatopsis acidiphila]|nr:site-specific integrase [Amycolatopsis acidiphila]UIJ59127.1 site-specific integrase [Amycolatopsis acidiphila]
MRKVLRAALSEAERLELVFRNVAKLIRPAKYKPKEGATWTRDEVARFLHLTQNEPLYPVFLLKILYGFRLGELLGLRWSDVDYTRNTISVRQQVQRIRGKLRVVDLKTEASARTETLLGLAIEALASQKMAQELLRGKVGDAWHEQPTTERLIFTTRTGKPVEPRNVNRAFSRICRQHGLRKIKLHEIRHTNATLQKLVGAHDRDIQANLGHADINTTRKIYLHSDEESRNQALQKVERLFTRSAGSGRCRQPQSSDAELVETLTSINFGAPGWTRTNDLRLRRGSSNSLEIRLQSVKESAADRTRTWLLGCVAVNAAFKSHH